MGSKLSTERGIQGAKVKDDGKPSADYGVSGVPGLRLRVTAGGHKSWSLIYSCARGRVRIKLGEFPAMGLKHAQAEAQRIRLAVFDGEDPAKERKQAKAEAANVYTFAKLAAHYLERHAKLKKRSWKNDVIQLNATILPALGHMEADKITRRDIIALLDKKAFGENGEGGHPIAANRAKALISSIFAWGVSEDLMPGNPAAGIKRRVDEKSRERKLSPEEIRTFWNGLSDAAMSDGPRDVLRLALLTGQRETEVCGAELSEFDFEKRVWVIPGKRTKNGKPHFLPLAPMAFALFEGAFKRSGCSYAFSSRFRLEVRPMDRNTVWGAWAKVRKGIGLSDVHVHDLRRTVGSQLGGDGLGFSDFEIALVLNQARQIVTSIYNRGDYAKEKLHMLSVWEARLLAILEGRESASNVIQMPVAR